MSKVKIQGNASGTGVVTLTAPNTNTDRTITLPDSTGSILDSTSTLDATKLSGAITPDSMNWSSARSYLSTNQSIANSTNTVIAFDTVLWDNLGEMNTTGRFTASVAGTYSASIVWLTEAIAFTAGERFLINFTTNGTNSAGVSSRFDVQANSTFYVPGVISMDFNLLAGEYIQATVNQNSGAALNILGGSANSNFSVHRTS